MSEEPMLQEQLAKAEENLALANRSLATHRDRVAQAERNGWDTQAARELLASFEGMQEMLLSHRDRLLAKLGHK